MNLLSIPIKRSLRFAYSRVKNVGDLKNVMPVQSSLETLIDSFGTIHHKNGPLPKYAWFLLICLPCKEKMKMLSVLPHTLVLNLLVLDCN